MSEPVVREAVSDADVERCLPVLRQLRPHLESETFLATVRRMEAGGFRLAFVESDGRVVAVAGWRLSETLVDGPQLYVDDLVTDGSRRSEGHGARLLGWLVERARAEDCRAIKLDSGVQRTRAHRFYFRHGLAIHGFHFQRRLD